MAKLRLLADYYSARKDGSVDRFTRFIIEMQDGAAGHAAAFTADATPISPPNTAPRHFMTLLRDAPFIKTFTHALGATISALAVPRPADYDATRAASPLPRRDA